MTAPDTDRRVAVVGSSTASTPNSMKRSRQRPTASTIDQAAALRDMLRTVAGEAGELLRSLKQQKRQARIVATTLASLKQLETAAG